MSEQQDFPEAGSANDDPHYIVAKEHSETASTKLISSKNVFDLTDLIKNPPFLQGQFPFVTHPRNVQTPDITESDNDVFLNKDNLKITTPFSQKVYDGASSSRDLPSKPLEDTTSMLENPYFPRCLVPFRTYSQIVPAFEPVMSTPTNPNREHLNLFQSAKDGLAHDYPCGIRKADEHFENANLSSRYFTGVPTDFRSSGRSENLQKDVRFSSTGQKVYGIENIRSSSVKCKDQYVPDGNIVHTAHQLLALVKENNSQVHQNDGILSSGREVQSIKNDFSSGAIARDSFTPQKAPQVQLLPNRTPYVNPSNLLERSERNYPPHFQNPDLTDRLHQNDISYNYRKLYAQTYPDDFDFAMNIMAYIEILNDFSWKVTNAYFDENVKKMVEHVWNNFKDFLKNMGGLQTFDRNSFVQVMIKFTQGFTTRYYDVSKFLNYCIIMCELGVLARKCNFKEAPLYIIDFLRNGIKEINESLTIDFEIYIIKYAEDLVESLQL